MSNGDLQNLFGGGVFDPASVPPAEDFAVLPPGKYPVLVETAEIKQTKKGTGHYIKLKLRVLDGPAKNRVLFDNINIQNDSAQCMEIGLRSLSALAHAIGLTHVQDTSQLVGAAVIASVNVKDDSNNVRTYSSVAAPPVAMQQYQPGPGQAAPPAQHQQPYQPAPQPAGVMRQPYSPPQQQAPAQPPAQPAAGKPPWAR